MKKKRKKKTSTALPAVYQIGIYLLAMLITIKNTLNQKVSSWIRCSLNCMDILSKFIMQDVCTSGRRACVSFSMVSETRREFPVHHLTNGHIENTESLQ